MHCAKSLHRGIDRILHLRFVGHIGNHEFRAAAETRREFLARLAVEVGEKHFAARGDQVLRSGGAKAGDTAGNQEYAVFDLHEKVNSISKKSNRKQPPMNSF